MNTNKDWLDRESKVEEINRLAHELKYIDGDDRTVYEALLGAYFPEAQSARDLDDEQLGKWLGMLRLWRQGNDITAKAREAIDSELAQRRTA